MAMPQRNSLSDYRYAYQGQEKDPETGKEAFQLRLYDSRIMRWLTTDPAGQYHSPYMAMGNNWIRMIDPDGGTADDWIKRDGKYVWDESVNSAEDINPLSGDEYVGKTLQDVKSHFFENNDWLDRTFGDAKGGWLSHVNIDSYYDAKVPLAIQDMFNQQKYFSNLRTQRINKGGGSPKNNSIERIVAGHTQKISGTVVLDGQELPYTAYLSAANNTRLSIMGYMDVHPQKGWTMNLANGGGYLRDEIVYLSNKRVGSNWPVLSLQFDTSKTYNLVKTWFLKYD